MIPYMWNLKYKDTIKNIPFFMPGAFKDQDFLQTGGTGHVILSWSFTDFTEDLKTS